MASIAVRTPYESFFSANSKEDQKVLLNSGLKFVKRDLDDNGVHFAYYLNSEKKELASNLGISLHPVPFISHSHPFSKILENNLLFNVLPDLMGNGKWIFSSIKKKKIDTVIKKGGKQSSNVSFVNKVVCAKDFSRYDFEPSHHEFRVNMSSRDFIFPKVYLKSCRRSKIFIHDEIHHWSLQDMIYFLDEVEPKNLTFTVVYPPELISGILQPQNPNLYSFEVDKNKKKLFFFPDGNMSEGYEQPERLDWLFSAAHIDTGKKIYTVKLIKSTFAHHLFQIVPGLLVTESRRFFCDFDTIDLSVIHAQRFLYYDYIPIKKRYVQKVFSYLLCLKKPDVESGLAKLRQMFDDEQDTRVVEFFSKFCKDVINQHKGKNDLYGYGFFDNVKAFFSNLLPDVLARLFIKKRWEGKNLFDFLFGLSSLKISVDTLCVDKNFFSPFSFLDDHFTFDENVDIDHIFDDKWNGVEKEKKYSFPIFQDRVRFSPIYTESFSINGGVEKIGILKFLHLMNNKGASKDERTIIGGKGQNVKFLEYSRAGPFDPPQWFIEEIQIKKEEEEEKKKRNDIEIKRKMIEKEFDEAKIKVDLVVDGWYVKVDFSNLSLISDDHEPEVDVNTKSLSMGGLPDTIGKVSKDRGSVIDVVITDSKDAFSVEHDITPPMDHNSLSESIDSIDATNEENEIFEIESECTDTSLTRDMLSEGCNVILAEVPLETGFKRERIDVIGDGNCFYRAIAVALGKNQDIYMSIKEKMVASVKIVIGSDLSDELKAEILKDGEFTSNEAVNLLVNVLNIRLQISTKNSLFYCAEYSPKIVKHNSPPTSRIHLHLEREHYNAVIDTLNSVNSSHSLQKVDPNYSPKSDNFPCLIENLPFNELLGLDLSQFKKTPISGRDVYFLVDNPDIDYKHNGIKYRQNLFDVGSLCPHQLNRNFNACLIQVFDLNSKIGFHKDDEVCYDNDDILSINLDGAATFELKDSEGNIRSVNLSKGDFLWISSEIQKKFKHAISKCSKGRINVTFRRHLRSMDKAPIRDLKGLLNSMTNGCMIQAIADNENRSPILILGALIKKDSPYWSAWINKDIGGDLHDLVRAANDLSFSFEIEVDDEIKSFGNKGPNFSFKLANGHFSCIKKNACGKIVTELEVRQMNGEHKSKDIGNSFKSDVINSMSFSGGYNLLNFEAIDEYAMRLICSFKDRTTGINLSDIYSNGDSIFKDTIDYLKERNNLGINARHPKNSLNHKKKKIHALIGFGGSGKSKVIQSILEKRKNSKFLVISPRNNLADDWRKKISCKPQKIRTFEVALRSDFKKVDVIIFDELTLFPNGYLDLLILSLKELVDKVEIVCIFDIFQARYHSDGDTNLLGEVHDVDRMVKGVEINYLYQSHRINSTFFNNFFKNITVGKLQNEDFAVRLYDCHLKAQIMEKENGRELDVFLVASRDEKKALSGKLPVMTFGESQGLTFNRVMILLSENSEMQDEYRWMVALTRARLTVCFTVLYRGGASAFIQNCRNKLICAFLKGDECTERRLSLMSPSKSISFNKDKFGGKSDEVDREERLDGDLFLKPFIYLGQRINSEEIEIMEAEFVEPKGKTHLCHAQANFAISKNFDLIRSKELREFRCKDMVSNQFCDSYEKVGHKSTKHTNGPMRFEAIYPRHKNDDDMTFWMAVHKRLRFSNEAKERAKLKDSSSIGQLMYYTLKTKLNLSFSHDPQLLDQCLNDFEYKKLLKSKATIANHAIRSDKDWPMNQIFLFMKSQLCTKYEKQYSDAKAGQTLACFQHMILVKFAPYCRYMEAMIRKQLPSEIYIHSNKNFNELNEWVVKNFKRDICVESDYEAFDASQDEYIVSFEIALMEDMGMPTWFINEYVDLKCTLGCKLGHFAIMRFTGEFCTFLFNTLANMAFTMCRYEWSSGNPIAFAGDDMCALNNLEVSEKFSEIFEKISLQAKVIRTETPMFCGWRLSQYGIVKEPELVYNRFMVAKERGNVDECLENYAIEVSYAYSLGERLFEVLKNEDQVEYHQDVVRFIVKRLDKLKTKVKDLFSDQKDV